MRVSKKPFAAIAIFAGAAGTLVGILTGIGATGPWLVAAVATAAALAVVLTTAKEKNELSVPEAMCIVLAGATAYFAAEAYRLRPDEPTIYDFIIHTGEPEDSTHRYERIEPSYSAPLASGDPRAVASHVRVTCQVRSGEVTWYRLVEGNFMDGGGIKPAPHSGEEQPPACP